VFRGNEKILTDVALNDVCIVRRGPLRVVRFMNYVNGAFLNSYQADGVILSTATGSTGYSLSAGGPIVSPEANIILMTPVSPHTLNTRSIIFKSTDRIVVEIGRGHIKSDAEADVSFDGGDYVSVSKGDRIEIVKSEKCTKIVKINDISFLEVLRQKMAGT
jgi:NAD+ kinase